MPTTADYYMITRDSSEAARLDQQHRLILDCQGYYLHPSISLDTSSPTRVADLGTGSAAFLLGLSHIVHPETELYGVDISDAMFPAQSSLPANVKLHTADIKQPFERKWQRYFDVVHIASVQGAMRKDEWAVVVRNAVTLLKPGGWLQWSESDFGVASRHAVRSAAPVGSAKSLPKAIGDEQTDRAKIERYVPFRPRILDRLTALLVDNERLHDLIYGYLNLHTLMADPKIGNLECVSKDAFALDRDDDGGECRRRSTAIFATAISHSLQAREDAGLGNVSEVHSGGLAGLMDEIEKDLAGGAWFTFHMGVFYGRKKR
jgi:SAM-dependent methyltransferase